MQQAGSARPGVRPAFGDQRVPDAWFGRGLLLSWRLLPDVDFTPVGHDAPILQPTGERRGLN